MRFFILAFVVLTSFILPHKAEAIKLAIDDVLLDCVPTPQIHNVEYYPGEGIKNKTNNLRRSTGIALVAKGEPIYVTGRIVDEDCIPLAHAEVEIWHPNAHGMYQTLDVDVEDENYDENFQGSGYTKTDNLGRFFFLTVFPGSMDEEQAPHINFNVRYGDFEPLQTIMFFPEEAYNSNDPRLKDNELYLDEIIARHKVDPKDGKYKIDTPDEDLVYNFNITLVGKHPTKHY